MPLIDVQRGDVTAARADALALWPETRAPAGRQVLRAAPPRWRGGEAGELDALEALYAELLDAAAAAGARSLALPCFGTGRLGIPLGAAAPVAVTALARGLGGDPWTPPTVRVVRFRVADEATAAALQAEVDALPPTLRSCRPGDWKRPADGTDPCSVTRPVRYSRRLDADAAVLVRAGLMPREMEDKWFVYAEAGRLHLRRSWTGFELMTLRLWAQPDGGAILDELEVCDDRARYTGDDEHAVRMLDGLIGAMLDGRR